jgi:hypothetical protein
MGSRILREAGSSARLKGEVGTRANDEGVLLAGGVMSVRREQPQAITTSVIANTETRLTSMAARYTLTMTYAKRMLTLRTLLSRFVRLQTRGTGGRDLV